ncbi:MAG: site-specific DNA-methyltransferase [Promethearchaeota archaeon]|nr:MAG: site-specific DNA-methyltransferase [Candidatus Lokiarchaeota archaeon]
MVNFLFEGKELELRDICKKIKNFSESVLKQEIFIPSLLKSQEKKISSINELPDELESKNIEENIQNQLIYGENENVLIWLLDKYKGKIDLIYIDPPFATGGDFNLKIFIGNDRNKFIETLAYDDTWKGGINSYLSFLYRRLFLMKKLLSQKGSIYLHLDWNNIHYAKMIMDDIFGSGNFRNEIIWAYPAASARTKRYFVRSYDSILYYTKTDDYIFNDDQNIYMEYSDRVKNALKEDERGIFYYRGGSHNGKKLSRKVYVNKRGVFPRDVWNDIPYIRANTKEYQGFSTQKPERLLKRIILASSNKGDLIADFFSGSGTTIAVADKLGRKWIGCDINWLSIHRTRKRLLEIENSHDMLKWSKKYRKLVRPFKISFLKDPEENHSFKEILKQSKLDEFSLKNYNPRLIFKIHQNGFKVQVEISKYEIPDIITFSKEVEKLISVNLDYLDFIAIDFNYNEDCFKPKWISYRTPKKRDLKLISKCFEYTKPGCYKILIKTVDFLGKETNILQKVEIKS